MTYTPYYDESGKEYKVQSHTYKNRKQYRVIDISTGKPVGIDRNTLTKEKPSTKVRTFNPNTGTYKNFDTQTDLDKHKETLSKIKPDPIKKTEVETATFSDALQTPDDKKTPAQKKFLGEYAPKLFPQYVEQEPIDPMKGMNEFQKATYRNQQFGNDETYKNTVQAYADSSTIYDKTKLPQFMLSREKTTKINLINSKMEALQGEIDSYIKKREGKPDYIYPKNKKALAKARADLKFQESELLKFKGLRSTDPLDLGI